MIIASRSGRPSGLGTILVWVALLMGLVAGVCSQATLAAEGSVPIPVATVLQIQLDPDTRQIKGEATIRIADGGSAQLLLNAGLNLTRLDVDGNTLSIRPRRDGRLNSWLLPSGRAERQVRVSWNGELAQTPAPGQHRDTLSAREPTAGPEGGFLPSGSFWYPVVVQDDQRLLHSWRVQVELPSGQRAVVPGTVVNETIGDDRNMAVFDFPHPGEGIDLMFGPYEVMQASMASRDGRMLELRTYFHSELADLAADYLSSVRDYLALYEASIGPYPFTGFSVVSSPTPTGFGMPTLTYLGREVLRLPFIRGTSLGHEVLHNWWGNGVYPDYAQGNWSEGLTTFMADYHYALRDSPDAARAMRLGWLRELSGIPDGDALPLAHFTARHHAASQAIGYGKAAMLFVMLEDHIGPAAFERAIQQFWQENRFKVAGWDALRAAFESASGQPLGDFFDPWLMRPGLPVLNLEHLERIDGGVRVTLVQTEPIYRLNVALQLETSADTVMQVVKLDQARQSFDIRLEGEPRRVVLDPESRLLRRLGHREAPPIMREVQLSSATRTLMLGGDTYATAARPLAQRILSHPLREPSRSEALDASPLLVIGAANELDVWLVRHGLAPAPVEVSGRGEVRMWTARFANGQPLTLIAAQTPEALARALRPLPHYGQQSWLVIEAGRVRDKGVWPADAPSLTLTVD